MRGAVGKDVLRLPLFVERPDIAVGVRGENVVRVDATLNVRRTDRQTRKVNRRALGVLGSDRRRIDYHVQQRELRGVHLAAERSARAAAHEIVDEIRDFIDRAAVTDGEQSVHRLEPIDCRRLCDECDAGDIAARFTELGIARK